MSSSGVLLLAIAGRPGARCAGMFERRMAIAQEDMAVLDFADPQAEYAVLQQDLAKWPWVSRRPLEGDPQAAGAAAVLAGRLRRSRRVSRASVAVETSRSIRNCRMLAANALYRVAQHGPQDKATVLKNLDADDPRVRRGASRRQRSARCGLQLRAGRADARGNRQRQAGRAGCRTRSRTKPRAIRTCTAIRASRRRT